MAGKVCSKSKVHREDGYMYYLGSDGYVWKNPMRHNKKGRKAKVGTEKIVREPGYLYYVDGDGYVARAVQARGGKKKKMGAKIVVKGDFKATTKYKQGKVPKYQPLKKVGASKIGKAGRTF